ncbi:MAG: ABC transporter permease [Aeromonadaceae bacterium]|nr:ABC transporter permease [Aeromonadaceae bacterium]
MRGADLLHWLLRALLAGRSRTLLSAIGIAIGIASVTTLTGIGEGLRLYLLESFSQFGSRLIAISPGKNETSGGPQGILANSRPLRLEDADLLRRLPGIEAAIPVLQGQGAVRIHGLTRNTAILGTNHQAAAGWRFALAAGRFLPEDNGAMPRPYAVLGAKVASELFANGQATGSLIRIGDRRFRITGVMASKGQFLGFDLDDMVYIPAPHAQALFNQEGLQEIDLVYAAGLDERAISRTLRQRLTQLHGQEDFTLFSQQDMLASLDKILTIIKAAIGGLGLVSLLIGAVGIFTIMSIAQQERIPEIGLLQALGCPRQTLLLLFLAEAMALALCGGLLGLTLLLLLKLALGLLLPGLPLTLHPLYLLLALLCAAIVGLLAGITPALRAMAQDPIAALRGE